MQQPISNTVQQRDRELTDYLYSALRELPDAIGGLEVEAAAIVNRKRDAQALLDDAKLNAELSFSTDKKLAADEMKRLAKIAVDNDPDVKKFKAEVVRYDNELEMNEAEAKTGRRRFQAAIALAELHAARINMMCHYQHNNNTERKP